MTLLLHPGFHKTATSWLQATVFAEKRVFRSLMTHQQIDDLLVRPHDLQFESESAKYVIQTLRKDAQPGVVDVISSEILSGNILLGSRDSKALANRLFATCDDAKVLLTVRAQEPIIKSIYLQYIKRGGRLGIADFLKFEPEPGYFWFDPATLEFDRLASVYAEHFGEENVLVLPQELLKRDRVEYIRLLLDFVGQGASGAETELAALSARGISPPASGIPLLRIANAIGQSPLNPRSPSGLAPLGKLVEKVGYRWRFGEARANQNIKASISRELSYCYRVSNENLQKFAPVDLASLGYDLGS